MYFRIDGVRSKGYGWDFHWRKGGTISCYLIHRNPHLLFTASNSSKILLASCSI